MLPEEGDDAAVVPSQRFSGAEDMVVASHPESPVGLLVTGLDVGH
jgi:hypothetical protein